MVPEPNRQLGMHVRAPRWDGPQSVDTLISYTRFFHLQITFLIIVETTCIFIYLFLEKEETTHI